MESREEDRAGETNMPQERRIPPCGSLDTVIRHRNADGSIHFTSSHGNGTLFSDSDIIKKLNIIKTVHVDDDVYASYTRHGKAIIQQQATRGCTAGATAMLIMDHGKTPNVSDLRLRSLGNDYDMHCDIEKTGLQVVLNSPTNLSELRQAIIKDGSCIVCVGGKLGFHEIVVDEVSKYLTNIRLRDPYHGWEITVSSEAFLQEWSGGGRTIHAK